MKKDRRVHIVLCYSYTMQCTYISEVCSSKKKAEEHRDYIDNLMRREEPDNNRVYWVMSQRVV